ncbi:hypothetical protein [Nonomuraea endophytica]|uniref:HTH luxR-type domain-containing protein n=1 Tax=Nonomuraea endophytica TaxID=714136 RepID=A0A7W8ED98_9ACTN|nr:hypothetical protein [Nonomuraea endophytica]MBB5075309.1 hypothetical protein [Nonomuraea endophytica]
MSLDALGVSASDELVYRFFLRNPGAGAEGFEASAIQRLVGLRLLEIGPDGGVAATAPHAAMERLIEQRLGEVGGELRRVTAAMPALLAEQAAGGPIEHVERIEGLEQTQERIWRMSRQSQELLAMHPERRGVDPRVRERTLAELRSGVRHRTIVHRATLDNPEVAAYFHEIHRAGDRHRVVDEPIQQLVIMDRQTAFVPIRPDNPGFGALMIRAPGIVVTLIDLFEQTWRRATDLEPDDADPTSLERRVLELLDRVGKDEVAARAMGVSVRTFRGYVADLMGRLGAASRFQIGTRAKERGWL